MPMMGGGSGGPSGSGLGDLASLMALAEDPARYKKAIAELSGREKALAARATEVDELIVTQRNREAELEKLEADLAEREAAVEKREEKLLAGATALSDALAQVKALRPRVDALADRVKALHGQGELH